MPTATQTTDSQSNKFSTLEKKFVPKPDSDDNTLGQYIPLLYHYNMLQDEHRVGAFREAIELLVKPGMHVVELGGGTGILSSFAARQGATVTCVERNPVLVRSARQFIGSNGLDQQIEVVQHDATTFVPDRPVDVVICEMLHVALLREKQAQVIDAFKRNYVAKFGSQLPVFIPELSMLMVQPVQQSFDFDGFIAPVPMFQAPVAHQPRTCEIAGLSTYSNIAYNDSIPFHFDVLQGFIAKQSGTINAVRFVTQNILAVNMPQQRAVTWPNQCLVLPLSQPQHVEANSNVEISFTYSAGQSVESLNDSIRLRVWPS